MAKAIFLLAVLLISATAAFCQCISDNDTTINETSIETATRNLIEGSTKFGLELLKTLNAANTNPAGMFFSPFSIWSALMVTYMGARGATENEMKNVLGIGDTDKQTTWEAFRSVRKKSEEKDAGSFASANRIYFQEGLAFKSCMQEMLDNDTAFMDFKRNPAESRETINEWVEKQTQQRIKGLIPPGDIDALTNMVIANAVYFKESWQILFDPHKTTRRRFTTPSGNQIFVNMMTTRGRFSRGFSRELECKALELPYAGRTFSMIILVPWNRSSDVDILANKLTPDMLKTVIVRQGDDLIAHIPKFKMEDSFELSPILKKMGLRTLFDDARVDLSGFTGVSEFTVGPVHHKAFIDVNEKGSEVATPTVGRKRGRRPRISTFLADHPFLYFIRDNFSNAILFIGTVQKPPEQGPE